MDVHEGKVSDKIPANNSISAHCEFVTTLHLAQRLRSSDYQHLGVISSQRSGG